MKKQIIRAIREKDYCDLRSGVFNQTQVAVYYGCNNYRSDMQQMIEISGKISEENAGIGNEDIHAYQVTRDESVRHASFMMLWCLVDASVVKDNLSNYTIL
jgi:hypothetical protein